MNQKQEGYAGVVAIIALVVAIAAIALAWVAYERTGADLDQRIQDAARESAQTIEQGAENATDALDAGPDGIDEDDADTTTTPESTMPTEEPTTTQP